MSSDLDVSHLQELILTARGERVADLVIKNARVVNVFTGKIVHTNIALLGDTIAGLGDYSGRNEIDAHGKYLTPGLIDSHMHLESSLLSPAEFTRAVLPHGTTSAVVDPHELANVAGVNGIIEIIEAGKNLPIKFYVMAPSCVPASELSTSGARITKDDIKHLYDYSQVIGLAEVMDFVDVLNAEEDLLARITASHSRIIDGHAPGLLGKDLQAYCAAGMSSDHETTTVEDGLEKLSAGMYLMFRQGSAARNLTTLVPLIDQITSSRCLLATDDLLPTDIAIFGHIDHLLRLLVHSGVDAVTAVRMATINAAIRLRIPGIGAIAPGYHADMVLFDDLESFNPSMVFADGKIAAVNGHVIIDISHHHFTDELMNSVYIDSFDTSSLTMPVTGNTCRIMTVQDGQILTGVMEAYPAVINGRVVSDIDRDILKIAVIERHKASGNVGIGLIHGFGLKHGALASSVAHDSHNIIVVGTSDSDMAAAVKEVERLSGGLVVVDGGSVVAELPLPIAGLISDAPYEQVCRMLEEAESAARELGSAMTHPFMTLSFMALEVIPKLKITDRGLVDAEEGCFIDLFFTTDSTKAASDSSG